MRHAILAGTIATTLFAGAATLAEQGDRSAGSIPPHQATIVEYMVVSPHDETECIKALDDVEALGALDEWQFGCVEGDHTGYRVVSASSADEALLSVPPSLRSKARAIKLHTFTSPELKTIHRRLNL
jgi:hypothetical protein